MLANGDFCQKLHRLPLYEPAVAQAAAAGRPKWTEITPATVECEPAGWFHVNKNIHTEHKSVAGEPSIIHNGHHHPLKTTARHSHAGNTLADEVPQH